MIQMVPTMLPIREVSARTRLSYDWIRKGCIQGKIVHIRAGNKYLINFERFVAYLNEGDQKEGGTDNE